MRKDLDFRLFSYLIVALGCALAFAAAVVPHYGAGHTLHVGVLLVGLLPYLVYGALSEVVRGWALAFAGALILAIDLAVKIPERFLRYDGYANDAVYYAPLVSAFVVLPIVLGLGARRARRTGSTEA